jgi:hypothetical protein
LPYIPFSHRSSAVLAFTAAIVLGVIQILANPFQLSADDIIAYLDIADAYMEGRWESAVNGYWSPLYSWLLGISLATLNPSIYWEFPVIRAINFLVFLFALGSFVFFLQQLTGFIVGYQDHESGETTSLLAARTWQVVGYALFLWLGLTWIGLRCDTPDMAVFAFTLLASGISLEIYRQVNLPKFLLLGLVLGLGFLTKAVMFLIALVYLAMALTIGVQNHYLRGALLACFSFSVVVLPSIIALSIQKDRFTFGDAGSLNYRWFVVGDVKGWRHWQGDERGSETPLHPTRRVYRNPDVFEFRYPVEGTYPPWHDPSYWYEGLGWKFMIAGQRAIVERNAIYFNSLFFGGIFVGFIALGSIGRSFKQSCRQLAKTWIVIVPAVTGIAIYMATVDMSAAGQAPLQPYTRYIAPFVLLLYAGVFSSIRLPKSPVLWRLADRLAIALLLLLSGKLAYAVSSDLRMAMKRAPAHIQWRVAEKIREIGLVKGDEVAILGQYGEYYHWARLARVRIIAEVPDAEAFWRTSPDVRLRVLQVIRNTGAKLFVHRLDNDMEASQVPTNEEWIDIGDRYYVHVYSRSHNGYPSSAVRDRSTNL